MESQMAENASLEENNPEFQFNLYAKSARFEGKKLILEGVSPQCLIFEVRTSHKKLNTQYVSHKTNVLGLVTFWELYFLPIFSNPNCFLNGFDSQKKRRLLTFSVGKPQTPVEGSSETLIFDTVLDKFEGDMEVDDVITKWDGKDPLNNISLLIDPVFAAIGETANHTLNLLREEGKAKEALEIAEREGQLGRKLTTAEEEAIRFGAKIKFAGSIMLKATKFINELSQIAIGLYTTIKNVENSGKLIESIRQAEQQLTQTTSYFNPTESQKCQGVREASIKNLSIPDPEAEAEYRDPVVPESCAEYYGGVYYSCCSNDKQEFCKDKEGDENQKKFMAVVRSMNEEECSAKLDEFNLKTK